MRKVIRLRMEIYAFLIRCLGKQKEIMPVYVLLLLFMAVIELLTPQLYSIFVDLVLLKRQSADVWLCCNRILHLIYSRMRSIYS